MLNKQEQALIKLYKAMPTAEIEARLAGPDLIELARGVAQNELQKRIAGAREAPKPSPAAHLQGDGVPTSGIKVVAALLVGAVFAGAVAMLSDTGWGPLFLLMGAGVVAQVLGKAFPLLGKILAGVLLVGAVAIVVYVFTAKVPTEERFVLGFFACIAVFVLVLMAGGLIAGARNKKSWGAFGAELEEKRRESGDTLG